MRALIRQAWSQFGKILPSRWRAPSVGLGLNPASAVPLSESDSFAHLRVRAAMHAMLVIAAALLLGKAVESEQLSRLNRIDVDIMNIVAEQSLLTERISATSALVTLEAGADLTRVVVLSDTVAHAQAEARRLDDLLREHDLIGSKADVGFREAYQAWLGIRGRVWLQTQQVVLYANLQDTGALALAREGLEQEMLPVRQASDLLLGQARSAAMSRGQQATERARVWTVATLLMLVVVVLLVTELAARAVRRQYLALTAQAAELERLALVAEHTSNGVAISNANRQIVWVNRAFVAMHGFSAKETIGMDAATLLKARSLDAETGIRIARALRAGQGVSGEMLLSGNGQAERWFDLDLQPFHDRAGALAGWVAVHTDISESRNQQQLLALAVDGAALGSWEYDIASGAMTCNARLLHIIGHSPESFDMTADGWNALIHPDDLSLWVTAVRAHLRQQGDPPRTEVRLKQPDGQWIWVLLRGAVVLRQPDGRALRMAGICMDINSQKQLEAQLRDTARTDELTLMPNRAVVMERVRSLIERSVAQPGFNFAVLFMDFDRFKQVNDTLGHGVGDELLRQIAHRLEQSLRPGDAFTQSGDFGQMAARMGGDEFVVVLDDIRGDLDAEIVAGRLVEVLAQPYIIGAHTVNSSVSIGIVTSSHAGADVGAVLRDADIAMYEAKRAGRGRYVMFEPSMHKRTSDNVALENDLRQALSRQELFVVYQPLVNLTDGCLAGMEALVRWRHPKRGLVSPVEFIPLAEAVGLIDPIGLFVLRESCAEFARLQKVLGADAPPSVAVNLSRAQLLQAGLTTRVLDVMREFSINPAQLILEVTESLAAQDHTVQTTLHELRALGLALSLDDFGTGYSSLSCLHELPVNTVKIDRSFVSQAETSDYHRVLIEATIRMAQTLGLSTVAEGIETAEQAALMAALGCGKGQGYLYSKPLEPDALVAWIKAHKF